METKKNNDDSNRLVIILLLLVLGLPLLILLLALCFGVVFYLFFSTTSVEISEPPRINDIYPTETIVEDIVIEDEALDWQFVAQTDEVEIDKVYLGKYSGKWVIFLKNGSERAFEEIYFESGITVDFDKPAISEIKSPTTIFPGGEEMEIYLQGFMVNEEVDRVYFTLVYETDSGYGYPTTSAMYEFNIETMELAQLYEREIFSINPLQKYDGQEVFIDDYFGVMNIEDMENRYLVVRIPECYACDEVGPGIVMIVNTWNRNEIVIDDQVGGFKFNLQENTVSYRQYLEDETACDGSEVYCVNPWELKGEKYFSGLP